MTTPEVHPAASEPNSISSMVLDTNQWKVDLNDLHSGGMRLDFNVPTFDDDDDDAGADGLPVVPTSRIGRRVIGVMTAMVLVAGLGFAAFRGRSTLQHAFAKSTAAKGTPAVVAVTALQAPPPPVVIAPAAPPAPPQAAAPQPAAPPSPVVAAAPSVPSMSANALPNAPKKRGAGKRRGK